MDMRPKDWVVLLAALVFTVMFIRTAFPVRVEPPLVSETYSCRDGLLHRLETVEQKQQWVPVTTRPFKRSVVCGPFGGAQ